MQFTIMIYEDEKNFEMRADPAHKDMYWSGTISYLQALHHAGIFIGGAGLEKPKSNDRSSLHQLGGYFIIEVNNHEEAIKWASKFPQRPGIKIEIRSNLTNKK